MRVIWQLSLVGASVSIALLLTLATRADKIEGSPEYGASATGASVHGMVYTELDGQAQKRRILVPGVSVYLRTRAGEKQTEPVVTNSRGWFQTPVLAAAKYSICWEAPGFEAGCALDHDVTVQGTVVTPAPVAIRPKGNTIFGRVTFSNGAPCSFSAPVFGLEGSASVTLLDDRGTAVGPPIVTNIEGEFIVPDAPSAAAGIRAECDGMKTDQSGLQRDKSGALQVTIRNTAPRIGELYAGTAMRPRRWAAPGETVSISVAVREARERNLHYLWHPSDAGTPFVSQDAPTVQWTLPKSAGTHTMYVLVEDRAGGHSIGRVDVITGAPTVIFSGTVTETGGRPLSGADVTVNKQSGSTNAQGFFFLQLPAESPQYLLNIHKTGYALFSRVLFNEIEGAKYSLAQAASFPLRAGERLSVTQPSTPTLPGAQIEAAPNAFVDSAGRAPTESLVVYVSTLDLSDPAGRMPGNFAGVDSPSSKVRLTSYGGVDVEIRDGSGNRYNLAPGKTATVRIPVDPAALNARKPPASVALWEYDPEQGIWIQQGTASLNGQYYEATVRHFSAINVAVAANDAACMRLHYDPGTVNFPFGLHITIPLNNGADVTVTNTVASSATDLIAELPPNEPIVLQIELPPGSGNLLELSKQTVNSGTATPGPANPNPAPGTCTSDANLAVSPTDALGFDPNNLLFSPGGFLNYFGLDDQVSADSYYAAIDATSVAGSGTISSVGTTVTGVGTNFRTFFVPGDIIRAPAVTGQPRTIESITDDTHLVTHSVATVTPPGIPAGTGYERVGVKTTLARFKAANNFAADEASAVYFNAGDLGFGRSMHMWTNGADISYYVSNYPNVEAARLGIALIATVAMDYSANPLGGGRYTKFYIFNKDGARVNFADLDGRGAKFVPRLCIVCHSGQYVPPNNVNHGDTHSRFIGFDLGSYGYSGFDPAFSRTNQEENFRKLNLGILQHTAPSAAGQELLNGWYAHNNKTITTPNQTQQEFVPNGWAGNPTLYTDVIRTSCRTCHVNRDAPLDWAKFTGTSLLSNPATAGLRQYGPVVEPFVCGIRFMPHAKVPYINFWANSSAASNPNRVTELRNAGLDDFTPALPCPVP
jgi:hypothetical protein